MPGHKLWRLYFSLDAFMEVASQVHFDCFSFVVTYWVCFWYGVGGPGVKGVWGLRHLDSACELVPDESGLLKHGIVLALQNL